jgi:very-short-patch-repair endonuclease
LVVRNRDGSRLSGRLTVERSTRDQMTTAAREFRRKPTRGEESLWRNLKGGQLQGRKFRRQHPVGPFVVDFFCPSAQLVLEIDGPVHDTQRDRDTERQQLLESRGYRVLRIRSEDVDSNLLGVLVRISESIQGKQ